MKSHFSTKTLFLLTILLFCWCRETLNVNPDSASAQINHAPDVQTSETVKISPEQKLLLKTEISDLLEYRKNLAEEARNGKYQQAAARENFIRTNLAKSRSMVKTTEERFLSLAPDRVNKFFAFEFFLHLLQKFPDDLFPSTIGPRDSNEFKELFSLIDLTLKNYEYVYRTEDLTFDLTINSNPGMATIFKKKVWELNFDKDPKETNATLKLALVTWMIMVKKPGYKNPMPKTYNPVTDSGGIVNFTLEKIK